MTLDTESAAVLADALGSGRSGWVPMIYPIRWLALLEIQTAIATMVNPELDLLLQEAQSFDAVTTLRADTKYLLTVTIQTTSKNPRRLNVKGKACDDDGAICMRFQASLRIVPCRGPS